MRGPRSALPAGLTVVGLHLLTIVSIFGAGTSPATATDCSCKYHKDGICILIDPGCERETGWYRDYYNDFYDTKSGKGLVYSVDKGWLTNSGKGMTGYLVEKDGGTNIGKTITGYSPYPRYDGPTYTDDSGYYGSTAAPPPLTTPGSAAGIRPNPYIPRAPAAPFPYDVTPATGLPQAGPASQKSASTGPKPRILDTGYGHLVEAGKEMDGYGLYSYAILPAHSKRAELFLSELFREVQSINKLQANRRQLNLLYIPLRKDKEADLAKLTASGETGKIQADYANSYYDYGMARSLLYHICNTPDDQVRDLCSGGLSRGPYIFTYAAPASTIEPVPPPFLFVDLSDMDDRGFAELLDAFRAQVLREDISDRVRIDTLRLKVLEYLLRGVVAIGPIEKTIYAVLGRDEKK
jgi:hypothetical protein